MDKLQFSYDTAYRENSSDMASTSLVEFFYDLKIKWVDKIDWTSVLELGCGRGEITQILAADFDLVYAVDFSIEALKKARKRITSSHVHFVYQDAVELGVQQTFDVVFDSHLFHCLPFENSQKKILSHISKRMNLNGYFCLETMVLGSTKYFAGPKFYLDSKGTLWKNNSTQFSTHLPFRRLVESIELEKMVIDSGLEIVYMEVFPNKKFILEGIYLDDCPDLCRMIIKKSHLSDLG